MSQLFHNANVTILINFYIFVKNKKKGLIDMSCKHYWIKTNYITFIQPKRGFRRRHKKKGGETTSW